MNLTYSRDVNEKDWQYVLDNSKLANSFHTIEYFKAQQMDGHELLYACLYDDKKPVAIVVGVNNKTGYHEGIVEVGTKSGGLPVMIDGYDEKEDSDQMKNDFIKYFMKEHVGDKKFFFYPDSNMSDIVFEGDQYKCKRQIDQTVFLKLVPDINDLWNGLNKKCRNVVRMAQKKGVTARIINEERYLKEFYRHYKNLRERLNTSYMSYEELRNRFDIFTNADKADLWVAFKDEKPLAYAYIWKLNKIVNFVYGSSDPDTFEYKPNNLLQWELIKHYREKGYELYNMWGVRNLNFSEEKNLVDAGKIEGYGKFKLSFGSKLVDLVRYYKV